VPRIREFDENDVLDKAMRLFWKNGYQRTSLRDLVEHTGVGHAGLYAVFKDKKELFKRALIKYTSEIIDELFRPLEKESSGRDSLETFFDALVESARTGVWRNGCFLNNSMIEFGEDNADIKPIIMRNFKRQTDAFKNAISNAKAAGDISDKIDTRMLADSMITEFYGTATLSRAGLPIRIIENAVRNVKLSMGPAN